MVAGSAQALDLLVGQSLVRQSLYINEYTPGGDPAGQMIHPTEDLGGYRAFTSANGAITDFSFYILTTDSLDDILTDSFGIRAQSTGEDGEGSIKLVDFTRVAEVPLPAAGLLLLGALGALGAAKRRRKA